MNRWQSWATRLASRRLRRPVRRPAVPLVLLVFPARTAAPGRGRRTSTPAGTARVRATRVTVLAPRTSSITLVQPTRITRRIIRIAGHATSHHSSTTTTTSTTHRLAAAERHTGSVLVRRTTAGPATLVHRHTRVERPPHEWRGPAGEPVTRPPVPAGPVVPRARRSGAVPRQEQEPPGGSGPQPPPSPPPPALDLDRITDDVVRRIDRRIVAHRERLGRI